MADDNMSVPSEELDNRFSHHPHSDNQILQYNDIRTFARGMAGVINDTAPHCREKALAFTKLEEAVFWANAAIARHDE